MIATLALAILATPKLAQGGTYLVTDPKGVNSVQWFIDSPLEPIVGTGSGVTGQLMFDPAAPSKTTGTITIPVSGLRAPVDAMTGHLQGAQWLDKDKYPTIVFEIASVKTGGKGPSYKGAVSGTLTMHGVSKRIDAPFNALYSAGGLKDRTGGRAQGDILKFRTEFKVKRSDFQVGPQLPAILKEVGNEIEIRVAIATMKPL